MFDRVEIRVKAGDGGDGAICFRREKFVPFGGPDGGNGGAGGNVVIRADASVDSLRRFRYKRLFRAASGGSGGGSRKHGRNGEDLVLAVPVGTVVSSMETLDGSEFLADLDKPGSEVLVARGGCGGWGNTHYASSTNQAPQMAQRGETGEEQTILIEMRLIADVGIVGYPNAGKSTLLAAASAAKPKVDSYPFTTIEPVLGFVEVGMQSFIMAEIPGLIEGAHAGKGLGHEFLRHVMRTRILIHLITGDSESPVADMAHLNEELVLYDPALARKPQIVALNKIDLPEVKARLTGLTEAFKKAGIKLFRVSAETGQGVPELLVEALEVLNGVAPAAKEAEVPKKVFRPQPGYARVTVQKTGGEYVLSVPGLERLMLGAGASRAELRWQLKSQLSRMGADRMLEKAGIKPGDKVRCGDLEWEW